MAVDEAAFLPGTDEAGIGQRCADHRLLGQLLTVAEQFAMEQQPQLVLLQKTMAVSEGVGSMPMVANWVRTASDWMAFCSSVLSLATISLGVDDGTTRPCHATASVSV